MDSAREWAKFLICGVTRLTRLRPDNVYTAGFSELCTQAREFRLCDFRGNVKALLRARKMPIRIMRICFRNSL